MKARLIRSADSSLRRHHDDYPERHRLTKRQKKAAKKARRP